MKKILFTLLLAGVFGFANAASDNAVESMNYLPETGIVATGLTTPEIPDVPQNFQPVTSTDFFDCRVEGTVTVKDSNGGSYTVRFVIIVKNVTCVELIRQLLK